MFANLTQNNTIRYAGIKGTGYYVPERIVTNKEIVQYVNTTDEWIQQKIGILERRMANENEKTSDLAYKASLMAIEDAGIKVEDIDLILLNCLCPDHRDPATACFIQAKLNAFNAAAFDINVGGCPGSVYSINIATNFIVNGSCRNVLVIGADITASTLIDWRDRNTCCFFGDGAGAIIIGRTSRPGISGYSLHADGRGYRSILVPNTGTRNYPEGTSASNNMEDGLPYARMDGKAVYDFATNAFPNSVKEVVEGLEKKLSDIDLIIPHQANINIIKEGMRKLDIPYEKAYVNIHKYGNTSGASVFIALAEAVRDGCVREGNIVVLASFGAGLAWGSTLVEWNSKEDFLK